MFVFQISNDENSNNPQHRMGLRTMYNNPQHCMRLRTMYQQFTALHLVNDNAFEWLHDIIQYTLFLFKWIKVKKENTGRLG